MAIKILIPGTKMTRIWVGECQKCRGKFSWNDGDALQIVEGNYNIKKTSTILCPTHGCDGAVAGNPQK